MKKIQFLVFILFGVSIQSQNITAAEYFYNADPGIGNGTSLTVNSNSGILNQTFSIPTGSLSDGFHSLYIRTFNSENNWSHYDRQVFYLKSFNTFSITDAEYFFNSDPGVGNGTALSVNSNSGQLSQAFSIPTTSLSEGFHSLYLRTQNNNGDWSLYDRQIFYIKDFDLTPDEVSSAEYFIDMDPGVGNGTSIVFGDASQTTQTLNIDSTGLADGDHLFYVRVQDSNGDWSIYDSAAFNIDSNLSTNDSLFESTKIHPSPFENEVSIRLPHGGQILKAEVYDTLGRSVYLTSENSSTLELSNLKSGIYILNLETNLGKASFKIMKK